MFRQLRSFIYGLGLGAGAMYIFDPERGNRRQALLRDQAIHTLNQTDVAIAKGSRDLSNRASGVIADLKSMISREPISDQTLAERVRSKMGSAGVVSHPRALQITAQDGTIIVSGPILAAEVQPLLSRIAAVRGVQGVENQLEVHEQADVPALQGEPAQSRSGRAQEGWAPGYRLLAGLAGSMLILRGFRRGGILGLARTAFGLGLLARGISNRSLARLVGLRREPGAVMVHKGIKVNASVTEVYDFWQSFANFPRFMANLYEVRDLGEGRSHWSAVGPAGAPVEWDAVITNQVPNQVIAWESVPGSQVMQAGMVRFVPTDDGGTQLDVQMSYTPPAGLFGHAVASFFGVNPKQAMDEDLLRFRSLVEQGRIKTEGGTVTREAVEGGQPAGQTPEARGQAYQQVRQQRASQGASTMSGGKPTRSQRDERSESGVPGGGQGRVDHVEPTGVYPASDPNAPPDAEAQGMASWGQGERGAAGYEDSGSSELSGLGEETDTGSVFPGPEQG